MRQFFIDLLLHSNHFFFLVLRIQVKFMIVPCNTELAAYSLGTELADAYYLLWEVMYFAFIYPFHFSTNISLITISFKP
jgi:hypothetical protein